MMTCQNCGSDMADPSKPCVTCGRIRAGGISWLGSVLKVGGGLLLILVVAAIVIPGLLQSNRAHNDRNASASLKTLATAQADFRSNDRDGNRVQDFWTGDVAGLYCISATSSGAIKLIELSIAGADTAPLGAPGAPYTLPITTFVRPSAKAGYWYGTLRSDLSASPPAPYRQDTKGDPSAGRFYNHSQFGFLAYPDSRDAGKIVFIINEGNTMFRRKLDRELRPGPGTPPGPVTQPAFMDWPADPVLMRDWGKLD